MGLSRIRVAACHISPSVLSARETTFKVTNSIKIAASHAANLVVFGETLLPAFPIWSALQAPHSGHELFYQMAKESIYADGEEIRSIRNTAKQKGVLVSLGFSEKVHHSTATMYNSNVLIGTGGEVLVHHRKLMPTFFEKLTWSPGDGHGLRVASTAFGKIGALICGENTNPLARYALMAQGEQLHISTWPAKWPTRLLQPTKDTASSALGSQPPRNYDNVTANRIRAASHCFEAKCFGVLCSSYMSASNIQTIASYATDQPAVLEQLKLAPQAPTMFLDPTGGSIDGFIFNEDKDQPESRPFLQDSEGILYADLDLNECIEGKQYHDVTGGYQRLDVFDFKVDRRRKEPITFED